MGLIDKAKQFLRGSTGLKGPAKTPPVVKTRLNDEGESVVVVKTGTPRRRRGLRNGGSKAKRVHKTLVAMKKGPARRRHNGRSKAVRRALQVKRSKGL